MLHHACTHTLIHTYDQFKVSSPPSFMAVMGSQYQTPDTENVIKATLNLSLGLANFLCFNTHFN